MISVKNINRTINSIKYKRDKVDEWKTPEDFKKNGGDCEDFAIAKYFELEKQGHDITETEFAYCELNGQAHMVLLHEGTRSTPLRSAIICGMMLTPPYTA